MTPEDYERRARSIIDAGHRTDLADLYEAAYPKSCWCMGRRGDEPVCPCQMNRAAIEAICGREALRELIDQAAASSV